MIELLHYIYIYMIMMLRDKHSRRNEGRNKNRTGGQEGKPVNTVRKVIHTEEGR